MDGSRAKQQRLAAPAAERLFLTEGDMREFDLAIKFGGVYSTFRSFQHLLSPENQESCLRCVHRHMRTDAILVLNLFDPRYDLLLSGERTGLFSSEIAAKLWERASLGCGEKSLAYWLRRSVKVQNSMDDHPIIETCRQRKIPLLGSVLDREV